VSGPLGMLAMIAIPGALALLVALVLLRRGRPWLGLIAGLGLILAVQVFLQVRLRWDVEACVGRACQLITDPAACQAASFGCHEWTGLAALFYLVAAAIDVVLLGAGCVIAAFILRKRRASASAAGPRAVMKGLP